MTVRLLLSYHYHRNTDLADLVAKLGGDVDLFADSGAYSVYTTGATISLPDYIAWLRHWSPLLTVKTALDVVGDHEATAVNTARMLDAGCDVMPVFHCNEPWSVLERMCETNRYVALGGAAPVMGGHGHKASRQALLMRWLVRAFHIGREHGTAFHGFGLTSAGIVRDLPFYSVDSSSYTYGQRWGLVYLWDPNSMKIRSCKLRVPSARHLDRYLLRSHGLDPDRLAAPDFMRAGSPTIADDRTSLAVAAIRAYQGMETALRRRHDVAAPPLALHATTGTKVYFVLAGGGAKDIEPFRRALEVTV